MQSVVEREWQQTLKIHLLDIVVSTLLYSNTKRYAYAITIITWIRLLKQNALEILDEISHISHTLLSKELMNLKFISVYALNSNI